MKFLIDTHTFLWFVAGAENLSKTAKEHIANNDNQIFISIASLWEMAIKNSLGKLDINGGYETVINDVIANDIQIVAINFQHTLIQNKLPFYHRDPFDRIIIAQAIAEKIDLISIDTVFDDYFKTEQVKRIW